MKRIFAVLCIFIFLAAGGAQAGSIRETPVVKVIQQCAPSVVNISTERLVLLRQNPFWGNYGSQFDSFFDEYSRNLVPAMKFQSLGSGVVVSSDGLIVTNAHVIHMASKIYVTLKNGENYEAMLIGTDNQNDIALIKITPNQPLKPIVLAEDVLIGETVIAIGNPFGLQNSVCSGIVSGTHRSFTVTASQVFTDLIQTDTPVNPGNSGGALLNLEGKLSGINLAIVQNAQNIGFAVPAEKVKQMLVEYEKEKSRQKKIIIPVR